MGCKECHKDSSREDKCDRTRQELLDDDSRGEEGKSRRLTDINGLCSGNYGCGHAIEAHTNGTTEPQDLATLTAAVSRLETSIGAQRDVTAAVSRLETAVEAQREDVTYVKEKLDKPEEAPTTSVQTAHGAALKSGTQERTLFYLNQGDEASLLKKLGYNSLNDLCNLLRQHRVSTQGLPEASSKNQSTSVQSLQRDMLHQLVRPLGLRVVKEVAITTEYVYEDKPKRCHGRCDQVLISRTYHDGDVDKYEYPSVHGSQSKPWRPPFYTLLAWEAKSRYPGGNARDSGKETLLDTHHDVSEGTEGEEEPSARATPSAAPQTPVAASAASSHDPTDTTPGRAARTQTGNTLTLSDITQGCLYGMGLRQNNHEMFEQQQGLLGALEDDDTERFLPVIVSDSFSYQFHMRLVGSQVASEQYHIGGDGTRVIAKMLLWALHHAGELEKAYRRQEAVPAALLNKENPGRPSHLPESCFQKALTRRALRPRDQNQLSGQRKVQWFLYTQSAQGASEQQ